MSDILVVGHYSHDTLTHVIRNGSERVQQSEALGGSVAYISAVMEGLGPSYDVISKVGSDFLYSDQLNKPVSVSKILPTTHFMADFTHGERVLSLKARCEDIEASDIPDTQMEVGLACGLIGEITPEALAKMADRSRYLLCDIQGLIRDVNAHGKLIYRRLEDTHYAGLLDRLFMLKASVVEATYLNLESLSPETCLVITEGERGCTLHYKGERVHIPPFSSEEVDSTGAGDSFMAGFAYGLLQGWDLPRCAMVGNYCGSQAVKSLGVPRIQREDLVAIDSFPSMSR